MIKLALKIINITPSITHNQSYAVVLGEVKGKRRLPIVIGFVEAHSINMVLENMVPPRPLPHDLIKSILDTFDIHVREVLINNLKEGVFYSQLICEKEGEEFIFDSRTSDALAIAVRCGCPIYIYSHIMESAGVEYMDNDDEETDEIIPATTHHMEDEPSDYSTLTAAELDVILKQALENEDYEKAARIRDEIKKRKI